MKSSFEKFFKRLKILKNFFSNSHRKILWLCDWYMHHWIPRLELILLGPKIMSPNPYRSDFSSILMLEFKTQVRNTECERLLQGLPRPYFKESSCHNFMKHLASLRKIAMSKWHNHVSRTEGASTLWFCCNVLTNMKCVDVNSNDSPIIFNGYVTQWL